MKITIQFEDQEVSVYNPEVVMIDEALELCRRALLGVGYCFNGELQIKEAKNE